MIKQLFLMISLIGFSLFSNAAAQMQNSGKVAIVSDILVFDLLRDGIRVSEVINIENRSNTVVDMTSFPIEKAFSPLVKNVQLQRAPNGFDLRLQPGKLVMRLKVPPGAHQVVMFYRLENSGSSIALNHYPLPGTFTQEIIVPFNGLSAGFSNAPGNIVEQYKIFGKGKYLSKTVNLGGNPSELTIKIGNLPLAQSNLLYAAGILLLALFMGGGLYLKRKKTASSVG